MLHLTTTIGKSGRNEREKRHFPELTNQRGIPIYIARGRRYIPHGYGEELYHKPHAEFVDPQYTEHGLDWKSRARYIPSPHNPDYPTEIWPEAWKSLRTFPGSWRHTKTEWELHPDSSNTGLKCQFDGVHKASSNSQTELSSAKKLGRSRTWIDKRNGIPVASPGDKSYQVVEYSPGFHKMGSTLPVVNFGGNSKPSTDTFIPLVELPPGIPVNYWAKERRRQQDQEIQDVIQLDQWRPATPLLPSQVGPAASSETKVAVAAQ